MYNKKKAFTLIEVIIVLALLTIVLGVVYQFFFSSNRDLNDTEVKANLQFEGQQIQDSFTKFGSQGNCIYDLNNVPPPADATERQLTHLIIALYDQTEAVSYTYNATNNTLTEIYTNASGTSSTKTLSSKVESIRIKPISGNYDVATGITVEVNLQDKGVNYSITSNAIFRNRGVTYH